MIKSELNIMICFQGPLICYVTPEVLPVTQKLYFSLELFPRFFIGLHRICLCAIVLNFEYWHLPVACKNWLCGYETWMKFFHVSLPVPNLDTVLSDSTPGHFVNIWQSKWNWIRSIKFETVQIHFNDVFGLLASTNFATMATWRNVFSSL